MFMQLCGVVRNKVRERGSRTSRVSSYLVEYVVELFVGRFGAETQPRERVVFVIAEQFVERLGDVPARCRPMIRQS